MGPDDQKQNFTVGVIEEGFLRRLTLLEARLEDYEFAGADRFTVADISVAYALLLAGDFLQMRDRFPPRTVAYLERMKARPAFQRAGAR
jgi:glutathione S-transferase